MGIWWTAENKMTSPRQMASYRLLIQEEGPGKEEFRSVVTGKAERWNSQLEENRRVKGLVQLTQPLWKKLMITDKVFHLCISMLFKWTDILSLLYPYLKMYLGVQCNNFYGHFHPSHVIKKFSSILNMKLSNLTYIEIKKNTTKTFHSFPLL